MLEELLSRLVGFVLGEAALAEDVRQEKLESKFRGIRCPLCGDTRKRGFEQEWRAAGESNELLLKCAACDHWWSVDKRRQGS